MQKSDKELRTEKLKNLVSKKGGKEQPLLQKEEPVNEGLPPLRDYPKNNNYPLSSAQKRLFILYKMDPNDTAYNIPLLIRIQGEINVAKLKAAFNLIVSRQDSLRTTFEMDDGHPVQVVHEQVDWDLKLSENPFFDPTKDVIKWIKPFDLIHGPLFRVELIKVSSHTSYLCLDMHHIIADARTFSILIEEFSLAYAGFPLAPLKIHYRDYAIWQSQLLSSNKLQDQKSYWMAEYSQTLPVLRLPRDPLPNSAKTLKGDRFFLALDADMTVELRAMAREFNVSLYMLLLSVYSVLLHRYTQDEEIIIGSSIEGRPLEPLKSIMGVFINTLPLRCLPQSSKTFQSYLQDIKQTCLKAFSNSLFPFEELAALVGRNREVGTNPIFQTLFDFHKASRASLHLDGLAFENLPLSLGTSKFDLSLEATEHEKRIELMFEYNCQLFARNTIERMAGCFVNLVREFIQNPYIKIGEASLFSKLEQTQILSMFDQKDGGIPYMSSFQELFTKQVERTPNRIAAQDDHGTITYEQLELVSDQLSYRLRQLGVSAGEIVATCMERSIDLLVSILGILKAGAAYLPIDPGYPIDRANGILKSSQARIFLSNAGSGGKQAYNLPFHFIHDLIKTPIAPLPRLKVPCESLAYVIFTSGSTGAPKGAMLSHKGMINHIYSKISFFNLSDGDILAQTSSQTFDVSIWQFLTLLLVGGKVVVFNQENAWSPIPLLRELEKHKITLFETVPSHMHLVMEALEEYAPSLKNLRYLILNGEALPAKICQKWQRYYRAIPIANAYGPTECSDDVCHYMVKGDAPEGKEVIPIGNMIQNLSGYILNESFAIMPPNSPGEFYVGGVGLGRGYIGQPDLTSEIFLPSPFSTIGERLYRTKDLVQYSSTGCLEYLGRVDRQVKIQGVRIELEEIENVLKQHPAIQQAVVLLKKDSSKQEFLAAYLILEEKDKFQEDFVAELKGYLKQKLPSAMVPQAFMCLERFPLNPSGKINTKALPDPHPPAPVRGEVEGPSTPTERALTKIWENLLKAGELSINDDFFEKGGNSLLAIQYTTQVRQKFGVEFPLSEVFARSTIKEQASYIDAIGNKDDQVDYCLPSAIPDRQSRYEPFPLTSVQQAYWLGRSGIFDFGEVSVHVYTEYEKEGLHLERLEKAWNYLIARHEALRMVILADGTQKIHKTVPYYPIKVVDLRNATEDEVIEWTSCQRQLLSHEVFPSDTWPLFKIEAAILPEGRTRLYLSFDALILDGWSVNNLAIEWKMLYGNLDLRLEPLELSFRDYVLTANKIKDTAIYQRDKNYWLARLEEFPLAPPLPMAQKALSGQQTFSRCSKQIDKETWRGLQTQIKTLGISPTAFIAAVFSEVLAYYSGSEHFTLNLTLFERLPLHPQVNQILGDFTSIVLLEVDRRKLLTMPFIERVKSLQQQLWNDLDHHLYSGVEFLRDMSRRHKETPLGSLFPVVLTSILGVENNDYDIRQFLGEEVYGISQTPQVWLDYKAYESKGELVIEWDYISGLFAPDFIASMHSSYCDLLAKMAADLKSWDQVSFSLISVQERERRALYNETDWQYAASPFLQHQFETKAREYPLAPAVIVSEGAMTYMELDRQANKIGRLLNSQKIKPNQLVAVIMGKSCDQVAACFGILKAGAAYLPLDPEAPAARLDALLNVGEVVSVLTEEKWRGKVESTGYVVKQKIPVISTKNLPDVSAEISLCPAKSEDLAYVIFTSGSTGIPKGVMIEHRAVINTITDLNDRFDIRPSDRVLSLSNLNFDLSVYDIFGLLGAGGAVVFPDSDKAKDPRHWIELILSKDVTVWNTVPMFMQMLMEYLEGAGEDLLVRLSKTLRLVLLSGDWIPIELPGKIRKVFGRANSRLQIISLGGATEASIWSIGFDVLPEGNFQKSIPYGFPLRNQTFHVLNDQLEMTPEETPGKLYIGGIGLAKGYWRDQEKTQTSFIMHPHLGRIYKTGDLGIFHRSSGIEFLGRDDFQVKIGGHRIELGELEAVLNRHPDVQQAVAIAVEDQPNVKRLAAVIVPKKEEEEQEESQGSFVIKDSKERASFTLAQKGRRQFSNGQIFPLNHTRTIEEEMRYYARKSYRRFDSKLLNLQTFKNWLKECYEVIPHAPRDPSCMSLDKVSELLSVLSSMSSQEDVLPKYLYPSAGSLYPVQAYLSLSVDGLKGVANGGYYYDPKENSLVRVSDSSPSVHSDNSLEIYLIGDLSAIAPLYGNASIDFCLLEAGYMGRLIQEAGAKQGLNFSVNFSQIDEALLLKSFQLNQSHAFLCKIMIGIEGKPSDNLPTPSMFMYGKEDGISGLSSGWYRYEPTPHALYPLPSGDRLSVSPKDTHTYSIFHDATCAMFFAMPEDTTEIEKRQHLFQAGYAAQKMMEVGVHHQIGLCAIGQLGKHHKALLKEVVGQYKISHILFLGGISQEQILSRESSKARENIFEARLKEYAKSKLPDYMVPNTFLITEAIPLSSNGKVDRNSLIKLLPTPQTRKKRALNALGVLEQQIIDIWKEVLSIEEIGIEDNFYELGGQSLLMTRVALKVREKLKVDLPLRLFFELPTVNALTEYIKTASSGKTENHNRSNFTEDASLDASIQRHVLDNPKIVDPKAILLTGSTGFLGTHILEQLLQSTEANIYCLVREEEGIDAHERLMKMLTRYGIGVGSKSRKIKYVPGDLSKPRLGCSKDLYSELCQEVDIIYHNGAWVNHVYDYKILKQTNVDSTKELLKIATLDKQKAIYYISTLVAANDRDSDGIFEEGFPLQPPQNLISGYQQTKWISEKLLHEAYQRQIPVGIFRPSTITGHEETGICSFENDHFLRLIKGCIQMGCAPYSDELIDLLPVNFVSKFIVSSSLKGWACNKVFNITSPNKIKWVDLIHWLKCNRFKIELIPAQEWKVCLRAAGSENALFPLLSIYLSDDIEHARHLTHKNRNVIEMLNKLNMEFPTVSNERLESYFKYLRDKKFVESNS